MKLKVTSITLKIHEEESVESPSSQNPLKKSGIKKKN